MAISGISLTSAAGFQNPKFLQLAKAINFDVTA
jgi:hypothetical protein